MRVSDIKTTIKGINVKKFVKKNWAAILSVILVSACYFVFGCPIRLFTGVCCPGCGMSRAVLSCLCLDFVSAFNYHPLVFLMPIIFVCVILRKRIPQKARYVIYTIVFTAFFAVYIYRLFFGSDVIYADLSKGLFAKALEFCKHMIFG